MQKCRPRIDYLPQGSDSWGDENASFSLVSSRHDGLLLLRLAFSQRVAEMHFLRLPLQKRNLYSADLTRLCVYIQVGDRGVVGH